MGALSRIQGVFSRDDDEGELDRGISGGPGAVGYDAQAGGGRRGSGRSRGCLGSTLDHERRSRIVDYALREAQILLLLICIFINIAQGSFQSKHKVGPSGLVVFTFIVLLPSLLLAIFMLLVPLLNDRTGAMRGLARGLKQTRPAVSLDGSQALMLLVLAFTLTISSNVKGCKDPASDEHASQKGYLEVLPGFCRTKRALTAFVWFTFLAWLASLIMSLLAWRRTRSSGTIPGFIPPDEFKEEDDEYQDAQEELGSRNGQHPLDPPYSSMSGSELPESIRYEPSELSSPGYNPGGFASAVAAARQSATFYEGGRPFDGPTPSGYGENRFSGPPAYEDPYDRIRRERFG